MLAKGKLLDVEAADRFLGSEKYLSGKMPEFGPSGFNRRKQSEWEAVWPIADSIGIVSTGQLRFVARPGAGDRFSISLIYRSRCVSRLDFVAVEECENNPLWAHHDGLPSVVCGPHFHSWDHNRRHALVDPEQNLPSREPLPRQIRRFSQAFPWLAARVNLVLTPEQRTFEIPAHLV